MEPGNGTIASYGARSGFRLGKMLIAVAIVFVMISSPFIAIASTEKEPAIWTSKDQYVPGEVVVIYGEGWGPFVEVTLELSHPDFETDKIYTVTPDLYGRFASDDYVSEAVAQANEPVVVTATQYYGDEVLTATTQFYDPAAYVQGYTLKPNTRWTQGDIKGYNEGDSVPFEAVLNQQQLGSAYVVVELAFDFIDYNPTVPTHGIDFLTQYWLDPPAAPFNTYTNSSEPFWVDSSEGTITWQGRMANEFTAEGSKQLEQVWRFEFTFAEGARDAHIKFGAHMALTTGPSYLGASYYPGSALHVRMQYINPPADEGNRDVPIALGQLLGPPEMVLEKECDPQEVVMGDVITFTISWTNIGQADACCVFLEDDMPPQIDFVPGSFLFWTSENPTKMTPSPGPTVVGDYFSWLIGSWRGMGPPESPYPEPLWGYLSFQGVVNTNEPGMYWNHAYMTYSDDHGGLFDRLHAECPFWIISEPELMIEKTGPMYAHVGDTITYTYYVTNLGLIDLVVDVVDDVAGTIATDLYLPAGTTVTLTKDYTITTRYPDPIHNIVNATGEDEYGRTVSDTDEWFVDILEPMINVTKTADKECAKLGEEVWYTITYWNPSNDTTLYNVTITDPLLGSWSVGTLLPGQGDEIIVMLLAVETTSDPDGELVNTVTAWGEDLLNLPAEDSASWVIDIYHPMIFIEKWSPLVCAEPGELIPYYINVSNPSWDTDMYTVVYDIMVSVDPLFDGWLAPYQVVPLGPFYVPAPMDSEEVVNTAYVSAVDAQEHRASAEASWTVEIFHPDIAVEKRADLECAEVGETITYTIRVWNPSYDATMWAEVYDAMFGGLLWEGYLAPGEDHLITGLTYTVQMGEEWVNNTVEVFAWDHQMHDEYASDSWSVEIFYPDIAVDKWADLECAEVGEPITYTIRVWNPSPDATMTVEVYDAMFGGLIWSGTLTPGAGHIIDGLVYAAEEGDEWVYNIVEVYAWDHQNHDVYAWDDWWVEIFYPDIAVDKWADKSCAEEGEVITYTIDVWNPSPDATMWTEVYDAMFGGLLWSGYLEPGEHMLITNLTYTVKVGELFVYNEVWVDAYDHQEHYRSAWDFWWVDVLHPDIYIYKWSYWICAEEGEWVEFYIDVWNPSPDVTMEVDVYDDMLGGLLWSGYVDPGDWVFLGPYLYQVPRGVEWVNNTAYADAWDYQGHYRYYESSWSIEIFHPAISIDKYADKTIAQPYEVVTYWVNVSNPSHDATMDADVYDDMLGGYLGYVRLAPGDWHVFGPYPVSMPDGPDYVVNTAYVCAYDHQYHERYAEDSWVVELVYPGIEIYKWSEWECAEENETVAYYIDLYNPSPDVAMYYEVYDPMLSPVMLASGWLAPLTGITLGPFPYVIPYDTEWVNNTAYVLAEDEYGHTRYAESSWSIEIFHPAIAIDKYADRTMAHDDDTIAYWIDVWNPSHDATMYVEVYDPMLGGLLAFGYLGPGMGATIGPYYYPVPDGAEWVNNTAYVDAWDHQWHYRYACDSWSVEIIYPDIDVEKTGPEYANVGDIITYNVTVTNTGDTPLYDVEVWDTLVGLVATYDELGVGESDTFTYTYEVPPGEGPVENTVIAGGFDYLGRYVEDDDSWVVIKYSMVSGYKYADINRNGFFDGGEPGLENWTIVLYGVLDNGTIDLRTFQTDPTGYYEFTMLLPGVYTVSEVMKDGWVPTGPISTPPFALGSGMAFTHSFGNMPEGSICGYKWWDYDLDGVWDEGELGIENWTIYLYGMDVGGLLWDLSVQTGRDGRYCFSNLTPGVYFISEEMRAGWYPTSSPMVEVDVSALQPFERSVNFSNAKYGNITGFKWLDEYMNGYKDGNEPFLEGWTICIEGTLINGTHYGPYCTLTDENGMYYFDGLLPGEYTIWEVLPEGWVNITPWMRNVTIEEGSYVHCAKFGNVELGSIDGWKFLDWDMDMLMDGDEPGIPGWEITLTGWLNDGDWPWSPVNATPVGPITITTDANGYFMFDNLLPGIYMVTEADVEHWYHVSPASVTLWIASGTHVVDVKFGNVPYTCIEVYKFEDLNGNGEWDEGEPGVPRWEIRIVGVQNDGVPVNITLVTDESGYARTCFVLLPGDYVVYEVIQEGWMPTTPRAYEFSTPKCMQPDVFRFAFGNFKLGMIYGYKYEDMDGDGVLDPEDTPIEGWEIYLYPPWGGFAWTVTNESGYFEFTGLPYGEYVVEEEDRAGWKHTTPDTVPVLVTSGSQTEILFLNYEYACICGYKWNDLDSDGIWDCDEPPIEGWPIYIIRDDLPAEDVTYTDENGRYCFCGLEADYYIVFERVPCGWVNTTPTSYMVVITSGDREEVPAFGNFEIVMLTLFKFEDTWGDGEYDVMDHGLGGWNITVSGPGVPGGSVTVTTDEFGYAYVWVTAAGTYTVTEEDRAGWRHTTPAVVYVDVISGYASPSAYVEFGNFECVDITIFKFEDVNSNGVYDDNDTPIEGWEIYAWEFYTGDDMWLYTDRDGLAHMHLCAGGWWIIMELYTEGWEQTLPVDGGAYSVQVTSGIALNIDTMEEQYYYEFGNFECVEIWVAKYWDRCSNGWYDPGIGDVMLEGWYFELYMLVGPDEWELVDWEWTGPDGWLMFRVCKAGTYKVVEADYLGWSHIMPLSGEYVFDVLSGDYVELWFGNYLDVEIPIFKYEDVNSNGVYDNGDVPIEGWYFELEHVNGAPVYSGYTDENGTLVLVVNRSGIYTLTEEDRVGWTHINPASGTRLVNVVSGEEVDLQMFGNFKDVEIWVFKFDDIYADGQYCPGEGDVPIEGWLIELYFEVSPGVWVVVGSELTGPDGYATFVVNRSGHYMLVEEARAGWWWILPMDGYYDFWVYSSDVFCPFVFANFKMGKIYGYKWNDLNGNGEWDCGEPPLANWTISFETLSGFYMYGTTTTNESGYYEFTGLPPGLYEVWEDVEPGWIPTSDPSVVVEIWGHREVRVDFFNFELGCIEGYKYEDMNGNGILDPEDTPIEGWMIYLEITGWSETPDGMTSFIAIINTTTTDSNGHYIFCGLGPGTYVVSEESRTGWIHTTPKSETVNMTSGACIMIHDFLNFELGCICGYKFEDLNSNGVWDEGEPAIEGWPIYIIRDALPDINVTYTDENGRYRFCGLEADYYIVFENMTAAPGWVNTTPTSYLVVIESGDRERLPAFGNFECVKIPIFKYEDVNGNGVYDNGDVPIEGWQFTVEGPAFDVPLVVMTDEYGYANVTVCKAGEYTVTEEDRYGWTHVSPEDGNITVCVQSGIMLKTLRFGNFENGEIIIVKFYDWDMDGDLDVDEVGLANWVIWLNGTLVGGGYWNETLQTDGSGEVRFDGLPAGTYDISERLEYAPPGWYPTTPWEVTVDITSGARLRIEIGNVLLGKIWGYKFYDKDLDGVMDPDEPGLEGWTIVLDGVDDEGGIVHLEDVTDEDGYYEFAGLHPGIYNVTEVIPPTWEPTTELPVEIDVSGAMEEFVRQVNIGNIQYAIIWGYKFLDTYEDSYPFWPNGLFDCDEYGLGNWEITLEGRDINGNLVSMVQYTDNMLDVGFYAFTNLLPGTYWVNETLMWGYYATRPVANLVMVYPFPMGPVMIRIDFGNLLPSVDPELNFALYSGWNLWSTPLKVEGGLTAKSLLEAIGLTGVMVTKLNTTSQKWESYVADDRIEMDFPIELGVGYYVWVSSDTVFKLKGDLMLDATAPLVAGWNIMGYNSLEPIMASEALDMVSGTTAWMITYLDAENGKYLSYVKGDRAEFDFVITPGRAYFIWVEGPGSMVY
ncbi:MAG: hypothetical protein JW880_03640 [Candidatus Thermoplasmatota archaeon]|nr:hypothetical protein [Candidatus Thermoplasmatota archaeon]